MYYRNANCAVVVYDITQSASLEKARSWIRELQRQADPSIIIALCGNKSDLSARRQVSQEEAKKYAEEEGLMWGETSAKSGEGVQDIFTEIGASSRLASSDVQLNANMLSCSQEASQVCTANCTNCRWTDGCWWPPGGRLEQAGQRSRRSGRAVQLLIRSHATHPYASLSLPSHSCLLSSNILRGSFRCTLYFLMCSRLSSTHFADVGWISLSILQV